MAFGLIPASAGSTEGREGAPGASRAHPRVRGEHLVVTLAGVYSEGSSPRPRGAPYINLMDTDLAWLIPASAGSTHSTTEHGTAGGAHPRVRGEHECLLRECEVGEGSSPRPRGAPILSSATTPVTGLIPASAGSTWRPRCMRSRSRAHPRVRGEHFRFAHVSFFSPGSSPRPRGARFGGNAGGLCGGLIPASAGSTCRSASSRKSIWAHPRVRGEHTGRVPVTPGVMGSSPRPRGARVQFPIPNALVGLIPASAGSTTASCCETIPHRAHPRVRGEHMV